LITIKYFPGNTLLHRLDPRTKLTLVAFFVLIEVAFRDVRILVLPFLASFALYLSARIPFEQVKSTWAFILTLIGVVSSFNAFFTFFGEDIRTAHVITEISGAVLGFPVQFSFTYERIFAAITALMRFLSLAVVAFSVVMTTDPALYGPALAKLRIPYKMAYVPDLALRYIPTYLGELETTMNAQMARGYKVRVLGGPLSRFRLFSRILNTVPLLLPVTINATLSIYDIADAMELRGFGAKKERTWYRTVGLHITDYAAMGLIGFLFILAIYLRGIYTTYWIPV
jgi:energy-coupling factor transport system permease protein